LRANEWEEVRLALDSSLEEAGFELLVSQINPARRCVDTTAAEIGISKRTLYNYYPSKDMLIAAYLSRRFSPVEAPDLPPAERILAFFDRLECRLASIEFRGCPFVNAVAELGEPTHPAHKIAFAFKEGRRLWFREQLTRLDAPDPERLATQLMLLVDGATAAGMVRRDPTMARSAKEAARTLLKAAGTTTKSSPSPAQIKDLRARKII
jgi:AcrR family transcriptional regulator